MAANQHLDKALARLEAAVAALERGGAPADGPGSGGDAARRKEIAAVRAMIGEAMQLIDPKAGGGAA